MGEIVEGDIGMGVDGCFQMVRAKLGAHIYYNTN